MVAPVGGPAAFKLANLANLDPRKAYDEVVKKITSGAAGAPMNLGSPVTVNPIPLSSGAFGPGSSLKIDAGAIQRAAGAGVNAEIQRNYNRTQDLIAYGRNPMAWHRAPPF